MGRFSLSGVCFAAAAAALLFTAAMPARAGILVFSSETAWAAAVHGTIVAPGTVSQSITTQILPAGISHPPGILSIATTTGSTISLDNGFLAIGPSTPTSGRRDTQVTFAREVAGFGGVFNADPSSANQRFYVADDSFIPTNVPGFAPGGFLGIILDHVSATVDFPNKPADAFPDEPYAGEFQLTALALPAAAVDEPGSLALLLFGLGTLALAGRGRRST